MEKQPKPKSVIGKKRKRKASVCISASEPKTIKVDSPIRVDSPVTKPKKVTPSPIKKDKKKKVKVSISEPTPIVIETVEKKPESPKLKHKNAAVQKTELPTVMFKGLSMDEISEKYPIFKNKDLIDRFLKVPFNNNQKGRIRQAIKAQLQGTDNTISADILHGKIQTILKSSENLTDADLRKLRILYNMLKTTLEPVEPIEKSKKKKKKNKKSKGKENDEKEEKEPKKEKEQLVNKVKGPKRYVVFIGNLPLDVDKEKLKKHFSEIDENIKDIQIPKQVEDKKSAIAFLEVTNELTYEMALSKHHSMLDNKRINVMYTTQQNSKITKSEAKGKAAKLVALQKSGKLAGSTALVKKRSHRRNIMKRAKAKESAAENA